jgi:hypothetical protein
MENRGGVMVGYALTPGSDTVERTAGVEMVTRLPGNHRATVGADRGYEAAQFVDDLRCRKAAPHVALNTRSCRLAIKVCSTWHAGYVVSQRIRERIDETFGWGKRVAPLRQVKVRGVPKIVHLCLLTYAAYNLVRIHTPVGAVPRIWG